MLFTSCPEDISAPMVDLLSDNIEPTIRITSPSPGDNYYSTVTVEGTIVDSVIQENDDAGQIRSIYYEIANDSFRKGKINIGLDDSVTADTDFGSGTIDYDISSGAFSLSFVTTTPSYLRDMVSITITAVDNNYNTTEYQLNLFESAGPYVDFNFYSSGDYAAENRIDTLSGDRVYIGGYVGNSEYEQDAADELASITWGVAGTSLGATLDLTEDSEDWVDATGIYQTTNEFEDSEFFPVQP